MRARHFSRYFFGAVLILAGLATASGGCSRQTEGERCDDTNGDSDDCDSGLVCTACERLRTLDVDRCCPPAGSDYSDPRCAPTSSGTCLDPTGGGGEGGIPAGQGATSSGAAANEGGAGGEVSSSGGIPGVSGAGGESGATPSTSGTGGAAAGEGGTESTSAGSGGA
jgi:hypothetical protein